MAKKSKKSIKKLLPKAKTEKINPVRKKNSYWKMRKIEPLKSLSSELSNGVKKTKIRVIGIGGGGGSIVSEIAQRIKKATFIVANTDSQALKTVGRKVIRFQFGQNLTQGLGTGMNKEIAELAAQNEKEKIKKLLTGQDLCIFVACLGGGTGSGAVPIFAKIARSLGSISYGIFTLPFKFEGEKKVQIAIESLEKLKPNLNAISIIPNDRIFQTVEKNTPLKTALSTINKNLAESLEALLETIYEPGLINIDFADLRTIFEGRGRLTYLNSVEVSGLEKNEDLIKKVLYSPLYPYTIRGAKGILFNIVGNKNLELSEVSQISKTISDSVNREAKIIFGISQKQTPDFKQKEKRVKITLLATGCGQRIFPAEVKKLRKRIVRKKKSPPSPRLRRAKKKRKKIKTSLETGKIVKKPQLQKEKIKAKIKIKKRKKAKTKKTGIKPQDLSPVPQKKEVEEKKLSQLPTKNKIEASPVRKVTVRKGMTEFSNGVKIRRNALEVKKDIEAAEKELIAEENKWETPTFLRKKKK